MTVGTQHPAILSDVVSWVTIDMVQFEWNLVTHPLRESASLALPTALFDNPLPSCPILLEVFELSKMLSRVTSSTPLRDFLRTDWTLPQLLHGIGSPMRNKMVGAAGLEPAPCSLRGRYARAIDTTPQQDGAAHPDRTGFTGFSDRRTDPQC